MLLYTVEGAVRTQIYLTADQRRRIDARARRDRTSLANVVREAIDQYLVDDVAELAEVLAETYGTLPDLTVPDRDEWARG